MTDLSPLVLPMRGRLCCGEPISPGQAVRWRFSANARASSRESLSEPQRTARFPKCFHGSARYGKGVVNVVPRYTPQWMAVLAALSPESNAFVGGLPCRYS